MTLYGFGIGFFGSLMGVSGGAISTIILTVYGKPIHNAVATSSGVAVPITIAGAIGFILAGLLCRIRPSCRRSRSALCR